MCDGETPGRCKAPWETAVHDGHVVNTGKLWVCRVLVVTPELTELDLGAVN